jgi:hypothetical protein
MDSVLKSDIFFFVTTVAIILLTIGGIIIIAYLWRIVRNVKDVSERIRDQAYKVSGDIDEMRKEGFGGVWSSIMKIGSMFKKSKKKNHEKKHKESNS